MKGIVCIPQYIRQLCLCQLLLYCLTVILVYKNEEYLMKVFTSLRPEFSVFVGDLASEVDDFQLHQVFKKYLSCKGAKVVTDQYGYSRYVSSERWTRQRCGFRNVKNIKNIQFDVRWFFELHMICLISCMCCLIFCFESYYKKCTI